MTIGVRLTTAGIAIVAFALCDLVHEVIGYGLAVFFVPGVSAISLSAVALQTTGESRLVAAAGCLANIIIGGAALVRVHQRRRFSPNAYFLWLFSAVNLLNGSGYPLLKTIQRRAPRFLASSYWRTWSAAHYWPPRRLSIRSAQVSSCCQVSAVDSLRWLD